MGYNMEQLDSKFFVSAERIPSLTRDVKAKMTPGRNWGVTASEWAAMDLNQMLAAYGWRLKYSTDGDVTDIEWESEKATYQELALFGAMAPWVEDGSYIEMAGEEGDRWRYFFKNGECIEQKAKISYE